METIGIDLSFLQWSNSNLTRSGIEIYFNGMLNIDRMFWFANASSDVQL